MAGIEELNALLSTLPGYDLLTDALKTSALAGALIPDSNGVWPGQDDYVPTHDLYFAAVNLIGFLRAQPFVRQSSSEGTSVSVDAPNWLGLISFYSSQSPILGWGQGNVLGVIYLPDDSHVKRTDMSGRGDQYGDIDTDL